MISDIKNNKKQIKIKITIIIQFYTDRMNLPKTIRQQR